MEWYNLLDMNMDDSSINEILEIMNCKLDILIESFEQILNEFKTSVLTQETEG